MEVNEIMERIKTLRCPQCGSTDIDLKSFKSGKCKHCGATVIIEEPKKEIVNNINITVKNSGENVVPIYKVEAERTNDEFMRQALYYLTDNLNTPIDVLDADFGEPYLQEKWFVKHTGEVTLTYNCLLGYDRKEQYREYSSVKQSYVTQERTVTDWKPFSGTYVGKHEVLIPLEKSENLDNDTEIKEEVNAELCIKYAKNRVPVDGSDLNITNDKKDEAEQCCKFKAEKECKSGISADHIKDFSSSAIVNITDTTFYKLPKYTVHYVYNDEDYKVHSFAAGNTKEYGATPDVSGDIKAEADKKNIKFVIPSLLLCIASIIISIFVLNDTAVYAIGAAAIVMYIITKFTFKKIHNSIIDNRQDEKRRRLDAFLKNTGLE